MELPEGETGGALLNGEDGPRLGSPCSLSKHSSRLFLRAQGGRALGTDAGSELPLKFKSLLSASRRNEGEVSVPEGTGRATNEGRRTTVSVSCIISTARSRLDGQTKG